MSFARYAAIVKNLRGVVLADPGEPGVWSSIEWLVKRFHYRNLGVTPSLLAKYREKLAKYLSGHPFRELAAPTSSIVELVEVLHESTGLPLEVVEGLVYASSYISPLMVVGEKYLEYLQQLSISTVYACKDMDTASWKLHMRIADYTILDFYEECVSEVLEAIESKSFEKLVSIARARVSRVEKDKKRYWRVMCESGRPLLYYVDMVQVVLRHGIASKLKPDHAAGLAIIPALVIPPGMK